MTEQNKNYNLEYKNIVKEIDNKGIKPKLFYTLVVDHV